MSEEEETPKVKRQRLSEAIDTCDSLEKKLESMDLPELMAFIDSSESRKRFAEPFLENKLPDSRHMIISVDDDGAVVTFLFLIMKEGFSGRLIDKHYEKRFRIGDDMSMQELKNYVDYYWRTMKLKNTNVVLKSNHSQLILRALDWILSPKEVSEFDGREGLQIVCQEPCNQIIFSLLKNKDFKAIRVELDCAPCLPFDFGFAGWEPSQMFCLRLKKSEWVTRDFLQGFSSSCNTLELEKVNLTAADINEFLKFMQTSPIETKTETLKFKFDGDLIPLVADLGAEQITAEKLGQDEELRKYNFEQPVYRFQCSRLQLKNVKVVFIYDGYFHMRSYASDNIFLN